MERMLNHNWVGPSYVLLFDLGVHLSNNNPIILAGRLMSIKQKADELKRKRKWKNTIVIYRTTTMNRGDANKTASLVSGVQQNRLNEVGRNVFANSKSVVMMDSWTICESMFDAMSLGDIHPPGLIRNVEISYFLDLYCFHSKQC